MDNRKTLRKQRVKWLGLSLLVVLALSGCSALPDKTDAISSATEKLGSTSKAPQWQTLDTSGVKALLKDGRKAAFIWYSGKELLVVGNLEDTPLPPLETSVNALDKVRLGYSFVAASPEAFAGVDPECLIVAIPQVSEETLSGIKQQLKETLAGKAMQKLALDQFYFWQYEQ